MTNRTVSDVEEINCYSEGSSIPIVLSAKCCEGLTQIPPKDPNIIGSSICTSKCGNDLCDLETESENNCPNDCKIS